MSGDAGLGDAIGREDDVSEAAQATAAQSPPTSRATVHDLGYRRYIGTRQPQRTRWRAIVRNTMRMAWQGMWTAKAWIFGAITVVFAVGFGMTLALEAFQRAEAAGIAQRIQAGRTLQLALDTALARAFHFLPWLAFILTMTALVRTVARDLGAGAFEFYFSRPVRAIDYVGGKLGGALVMLGAQLMLAPLLLVIFRVAVDWDNIGTTWILIPQVLVVGILATLVFATVPLAISALVIKPRNGLIVWALIYVLGGLMAMAASKATGIKALLAFDLFGLILGATYGFFGKAEFAFRQVPSLGFSLVCLSGYIALAIGVLYVRVRSIEGAGIGAR